MNLIGLEKLTRSIAGASYRFIFKEDMSEGAYSFAKNLFYIAFGYSVAAMCVFVFQIMSGRVLGPEEYGKYAVVDSITMFLHVPMILGLSTAAIKYCAGTKDEAEHKKIISSSFWLVSLSSLVSTIIFIVFYRQLSKIFSVSPTLFLFSIVFAAFYTTYTLSTNILRGLNQMKKMAILRGIYGLAILVSLFIFILLRIDYFGSIIFSISLAYIIISILTVISIRKYISFKINIEWTKKLFHYGNYAILGNICLAFLPSFNDLVINKNLSIAKVGIYNAYYFSSVGIVIFLMSNFITVFFPMASAHTKKGTILKKINKLSSFIFLIGLPISFVVEWLILSLYGNKYPMYIMLMVLFAMTNVFIAIYQLYNWIFYSEGLRGAKLATIASMVTALTNVFLAVYLTPIWGLYGATFSIGFSYLVGIAILLILKNKLNLTEQVT
jgi:O-antigen/teichoic acid export membrane protein